MTRHIYLQIITAFSLLFSWQLSYAQQWYQVEVIVFEQLTAISDEQWPVMSSIPSAPLDPDMATDVIQPGVKQALVDSAKRLANSSRYRLHYHQAWQQPILTKRHAQAVEIINPNNSVEGNIRLYKGTYLYSKVDIWLNKNQPVQTSWSDTDYQAIDSAPRNPHLLEARRVRSKKLHYFDHPKIGVLLQLTPIETPDVITQQQNLQSYSLPIEAKPITAE